MIQRKSSRITDSLVNSSHEDHFNVTKAIRDDAPITNNTTVMKSVNFEASRDGAYILRKPLVKKTTLNKTNQVFLSNKSDILTINNGQLSITGATKLILRFYDNKLIFHEYEYQNSMPVPWLTVKDSFNTSDHTLLNTIIDHTIFVDSIQGLGYVNLEYVDEVTFPQDDPMQGVVYFKTEKDIYKDIPLEDDIILPDIYIYIYDINKDETKKVPMSLYSVDLNNDGTLSISGIYDAAYRADWDADGGTVVYYFDDVDGPARIKPSWKLINDYYDFDTGFHNNKSVGNDLPYFIKIYKDSESDNTYVIELVNAELNTITSALDEGNTQNLDINLLLNNPYALRDLYGYGYVSCTKIVPYVLNEVDSWKVLSNFSNIKIWELTERNFHNENGTDLQYSFKILVSSNPKTFDRRYLFLKAFLTTAITSAKYYCCWEYSKDGGVTWEVCPEFIAQNPNVTEILVSDLSSAEFDKMMYEDSLEQASSYLVKKKVVRMALSNNDYSFEDLITSRPDVLILDHPNLSYKYRFQIYLDTEKTTPTPEDVTYTATKTSFTASTEGFLDNLGTKIKYETAKNGATNSPALEDGYLVLYEASSSNIGDGSSRNPNRYGLGNSITIKSLDSNYKIKNVTLTLAPKHLISGTDYEYLGSALGALGSDSLLDPWNGYSGNQNPYGMTSVVLNTFGGGITEVIYNAKNLWLGENKSKTYSAASYGNDYILSIVNLTRCLMNWNGGADLENVSGVTDIEKCRFKIVAISVTYVVTNSVQYTSTYLTSTTGIFQIPYADNFKTTESLALERDRLFNGQMFYNDSQKQLLVFSDRYVYVSGTNSAIIKLMNSLELPDTVSKIIPWRNYLLLFTPKAIYLTKYDATSDTYTIKTLSNSVGVPASDANTIIPILNSVYFKSGDKIYKLIPNLYYASDDILNIHQVSMGVNSILENIINNYIEGINFAYANADEYNIFIPLTDFTYRITYDFNKQVWTVQKYNIVLTDIITVSNLDIYLYDDTKLYYFKESLETLLADGLKEYCVDNNLDYEDYDLNIFNNGIPYADYPNHTPKEIIQLVLEHNTGAYEDIFSGVKDEIYFMIDFGQKSSNYTLDKQFLESKLIFTTQSIKDTFPITLDIYTDGVSRPLHWDANTDGALWKTSLDDVGILNTNFNPDGADYNGIFRQLIVKYSGRGKSIRHVISGYSKALFKFYSMDVRGRILPKKR